MSSAWRTAAASPTSARQSRSSALVGLNSEDRDENPAVPQWLIDEQKELRSAGRQATPPVPATSSKKRSDKGHKDRGRDSQPPPDDDLIMVDLLDGSHLPTRPSPKQSSMSPNSDSIISLPPIDSESENRSWQSLKAEAQVARRSRSGASFGSFAGSNRRSKQQFDAPASRFQRREPEDVPYWDSLSTSFDSPSAAVRQASVLSAEPLSRDNPPPARPDRPRVPSLDYCNSPRLNAASSFVSQDSSQGRLLRKESYSLRNPTLFLEDDMSIGASSRSNHSSNHEQHFRGKKGRRRPREHFQPGVWGWRMPAEEDAIMPSGAWIYLALIGFLTFLIAFSVNNASHFLSRACIGRLSDKAKNAYGEYAGLATLAGLRGLALAASFLIVLKIAPQYSAGSGIPEMKCVLSGVLLQRMLNWQTLVAKMVGLTFSLTSAISIGRLGPFIHMSGITAALVSKIPWFTVLRSSARFQLQALSAAMAAGVGATFGAPIGGTMLSIEVMSTYYYIHWLPMAFYCSIMGYYFVIAMVEIDSHAFFSSNVTLELQVESLQRLVTYVVLGVLCGFIGAALVQFTKSAFIFRRRHFTNSTPLKTTVMLVVFAIAHTLVTFKIGGVLPMEQKNGVLELINSSHENEIWLTDAWQVFSYAHWNSCLSLLLAVVVKFILTGLSLVMPVPAGTFMPIFEIGALVGRAFGELCSGFSFVDWVDPRATAIIGAAAVTSGALHTTSIAVVMMELTHEAIDVLPLAVGVIVSYGVSKQLCSDLFSELIKIRRLPFILGLRERYPTENKQFFEDVSSVAAGSFMSKDFPFVTPQSSRGDLFRLLTQGGKPWRSCAFLSDKDERRLWGTITHQTLWDTLGEDLPTISTDNAEKGTYGSLGMGTSHSSVRDDEFISMLREFDPSVGHPLVDMGPMQISVQTPFWKIITYFQMLSMSTMYVLDDGVTVGSLNRAQVIQHSINIERRAKRKREQAKAAEERRSRDERELREHFRRSNSSRLAARPSGVDLCRMSRELSGRRSRQGSITRMPPRP